MSRLWNRFVGIKFAKLKFAKLTAEVRDNRLKISLLNIIFTNKEYFQMTINV